MPRRATMVWARLHRSQQALRRLYPQRAGGGPSWAQLCGFKEHFYRAKDGRVTVAYLDGSGWFDVFKDTHWSATSSSAQTTAPSPPTATRAPGTWSPSASGYSTWRLARRSPAFARRSTTRWVTSSGRRMATSFSTTAGPGTMAPSPPIARRPWPPTLTSTRT